MDDADPLLREAILEAVDNQLSSDDPPETRMTLDRLVAQGYPRVEARELIAAVVATEIFEVMKTNRPFNLARFTAALARLPALPDED